MKYNFIEIGTCDYHTLLEGSSPNELGISVEPIKIYLDRLADKSNVIKVNCAITSEDKMVDLFYVTPENQNKHNLPFTKGWGTIIKPHKSHGENPEDLIESGILTKSQIQGITWKTLCEKYNVKEVDWVKIDAEGHEVNVLKGAKELIKKFKPLILTEFDVNNKQELIDLLPEYKFEDISYNYELDNLTYRNLMFKGTPQ